GTHPQMGACQHSPGLVKLGDPSSVGPEELADRSQCRFDLRVDGVGWHADQARGQPGDDLIELDGALELAMHLYTRQCARDDLGGSLELIDAERGPGPVFANRGKHEPARPRSTYEQRQAPD